MTVLSDKMAQVVGYVTLEKKRVIEQICGQDRHYSQSRIIDEALTEEFLKELLRRVSGGSNGDSLTRDPRTKHPRGG